MNNYFVDLHVGNKEFSDIPIEAKHESDACFSIMGNGNESFIKLRIDKEVVVIMKDKITHMKIRKADAN
ncbi:hypothetical protein [Terribacillus saccharophilus]|uniref:hypothetical protein n=1 Tax=Terribacillus saccharophilus TaxID=361277 RepID=UPI000BA744A7|nr:hypothetical protein [Terribacillus saccharophilus]PAF19741.1 hypothetical protein CHH51_01375 [Terribacillus saccharophilus]